MSDFQQMPHTCPECTTNEGPMLWCDCIGEPRLIDHACRLRAHHPIDCPEKKP